MSARLSLSAPAGIASTKTVALESAIPDQAAAKEPYLLYVALVAIGLSGFPSFRISLAGLSVHPFVIPLGICFLMYSKRLKELNSVFMWTSATFLLLYSLITLAAPYPNHPISELLGPSREIPKIVTAALMILTPAIAVRSELAFRRSAMATVLACSIIASRVFGSDGGLSGANPLEGISNKNGYSLFALPAMALGLYVILDPLAKRWERVLTFLATIICVYALFQTANRSGWLGAVVILGLLIAQGRKRFQTGFVALVLGASIYFVVSEYGNSAMMSHRLEQTQQGTLSDRMRVGMVEECFNLGLENPLYGAGPRLMPLELARRIRSRSRVLDSHNVFAHLAGGYGLITLALLLGMGLTLYRYPSGQSNNGHSLSPISLLRMLLWLWVMRGIFTAEILYTPVFCVALGLGIGLCTLTSRYNIPPPNADPKPAKGASQWPGRVNPLSPLRPSLRPNRAP